jgi:membrane protease YdiL (CAAX protease family)
MLSASSYNPAFAHSVGSLLTVNAIPRAYDDTLPRAYLAAQHTLSRSIWLHLTPALLSVAALPFVGPRLAASGYPLPVALALIALTAPIPFMLWVLAYGSYGRNRTLSLQGIVAYRERLALPSAAAWVILLALWGVLCLYTLAPLDGWVAAQIAGLGLPAWLTATGMGSLASAGLGPRVLTVGVLFVVNGLALPLLEELYFRGYLLPRMERAGNWAPLLSLGLFALYSLLPLGHDLSRFAALLPVVWVVWRTRNVNVGIAARILLNCTSLLMTLPLIFK